MSKSNCGSQIIAVIQTALEDAGYMVTRHEDQIVSSSGPRRICIGINQFGIMLYMYEQHDVHCYNDWVVAKSKRVAAGREVDELHNPSDPTFDLNALIHKIKEFIRCHRTHSVETSSTE